MAGIGFELKRLFNGRGYISRIKAYFVSTLVTVGPTLLCILLITVIQIFLSFLDESYKNKSLYLASITYAFAFSMIFSGGFSMIASRYAADCMYEKKPEKIIPSFIGVTIIVLIIDFFSTLIFLSHSALSGEIKILTYMIFAELSVIWIELVYMSLVKDYISIFVFFLIGVMLIFTLSILLVDNFNISPYMAVLVSTAVGFLVIMVSTFVKIYTNFGMCRVSLVQSLEFIKLIDKYPELLAIGFLYYLGMYGHAFVFWFSGNSTVIEGTYRFCTLYDVPVFYSFLTIIPTMVLFIIKAETSFYPKYKEYYFMAQGNGNMKDISRTKSDMISTLSNEVKFLMEIQFLIVIAAIVIGMRALPYVGISYLSVDIYCILALGSFSYAVMYVLSILLLYFDDRMGVLFISLSFCILSYTFSIITMNIGPSFYGYGFFFAAFFSMIAAFARLYFYLNKLEYFTFAAQPIFQKEINGFFTKTYNKFSGMRLEWEKGEIKE